MANVDTRLRPHGLGIIFAMEGAAAADDGQPAAANPYPRDSDAWHAWIIGWTRVAEPDSHRE